MNSNTLIIIQARLGSTRYKKKVLKKFFNKPLILNIVKNFTSKEYISTIVATTNNRIDNELVKLLKNNKISFFRGSSENLIKRFYDCSTLIKKKYELNDFKIVRVCADNPFLNDTLVKNSLKLLKKNFDYVGYANDMLKGYTIESFWYSSLKKLVNLKTNKFEKEHIGPGFLNKTKFKTNFLNIKFQDKTLNKICRAISLSFDDEKDYKRLKRIEKILKSFRNKNKKISYVEMLKYLKKSKIIDTLEV